MTSSSSNPGGIEDSTSMSLEELLRGSACTTLEEELNNFETNDMNNDSRSSPLSLSLHSVEPSDNGTSNSRFITSSHYTYAKDKEKCQIDHENSLETRRDLDNKKDIFDAGEGNFESVQTSPADSSFEDPKDIKYKEKRQKNNIAAKKSRDARKIRENQLKVKVICLENANEVLRAQVHREKDENKRQTELIKMLEKQVNDLKQSRKCTDCSSLITCDNE